MVEGEPIEPPRKRAGTEKQQVKLESGKPPETRSKGKLVDLALKVAAREVSKDGDSYIGEIENLPGHLKEKLFVALRLDSVTNYLKPNLNSCLAHNNLFTDRIKS
jgi:hypothetical protein